MIDTHTHIYMEEYDEDRDTVVNNAQQNKVSHVVLPNVDADSIDRLHRCHNLYPDFTSTAMGLHPTSVDDNYETHLAAVKNDLFSGNHVAVGEIGLDLYWDKTFARQQEIVLTTQLNWALELNLPVILHVRKAYAEIFKILSKFNNRGLRGVFHCFGGGVEEVKKAVSLGFFIGIGGVLTYKNSTLPSVIENVKLENILLETDAPFLSPVPYRGKRNEPAYLANVAHVLSSIFNVDDEIVDKITTENARTLFHI